MSSFWDGFEKTAAAAHHIIGGLVNTGFGAGAGALGGGEDDEHGNTKNRHIGALRGAAALGTGSAVGGVLSHKMMGKQLELLTKGHAGKAVGLGALGAGAGLAAAYGGYKAMKHLGPKYDKEKAQAAT